MPSLNLYLPLRKSASLSLRVEATRPATSMFAPLPKTMPLGLMMKTRPLDCKAPRIFEGSWPVMRFNMALAPFCWMKRVISSLLIEKLCQLMMALGLLVMLSVLPFAAKPTLPLTTVAPLGLAKTGAVKNSRVKLITQARAALLALPPADTPSHVGVSRPLRRLKMSLNKPWFMWYPLSFCFFSYLAPPQHMIKQKYVVQSCT